MIRIVLPFCIAVTAAVPALAQGTSSLTTLVDTKRSSGVLDDVVFEDFDSDGENEALLKLSGPCDGSSCPWELIDTIPGGTGYDTVFGGRSTALDVVPTEPDGAVISADGVIFAWNGREAFPHFDLLEYRQTIESDLAVVNAVQDLTGTRHAGGRIAAYEIDLVGDPSNEHVYILHDEDSGYMTRFLIADSNGDLAAEGWSMDRPRLFRGADSAKTAKVLSVTPAGFLINTLR